MPLYIGEIIIISCPRCAKAFPRPQQTSANPPVFENGRVSLVTK